MAAAERRLGRGLGSLLGTEPTPAVGSGIQEIALERIRPNAHQPRRVFEVAAMEELTESIRQHGVLQAVVVRRAGEDFELVAGERRTRAARLAGLSAIPAMVRDDISDSQMLELALVENVQRQDLDPIERARGSPTKRGAPEGAPLSCHDPSARGTAGMGWSDAYTSTASASVRCIS